MADSGEPNRVTTDLVIEPDSVIAVAPAPSRHEPADAPAPRRWRRLALMLSIPLLIAAVGGWFWLTGGRYVGTDNAYVRQDVVAIGPDVSGRIVAVMVSENQPVKAGDLLFRIDPEPYRIALAQAEAAVATARVQVATMQTDVGGARADIASAQADVLLAQQRYDRQSALMDRGFSTRADIDAAQHALSAARAELAKARADAARAATQLGSGTPASNQAAAIQTAIAQRDKAALDLARTEVRAPSDGVVTQTSRLQIGQIALVGASTLSLVRSSRAWVEANYKETDLDHMAVGQTARIKLDAYPGLAVKGHVASIGAGTGSEFALIPAQNATGNWVKVTQRVPVRIAIDGNPPRAMIAGLSAKVSIDTQSSGQH